MKEFLDRRIAMARETWGLETGVVLVYAGDQISIAGTDQHYEFQAHPDFRYFTGIEVASGVLGIDLANCKTQLFAVHPDAKDRVWHTAYTVGSPLEELKDWVGARADGDDEVRCLGAAERLDEALQKVVHEQRVLKDEAEVTAIRAAAAATAKGFGELTEAAAPGLSEHQLRSVIDSAFMFNGAQRPAYDSIVAGGPNAAVLHSTPGSRVIEDGDFLLVDAGARVDGYAADVTRTWCVGEPTDEQRNLWSTVYEAQQLAIDMCRPGTEYRQIHLSTAEHMARSLIDVGLMNGEPADLVMQGAVAVFFPHGIGHFIGQNVHDTNGFADDREPTSVGGTIYLRTDRELEPNMVVTIEPGLYFIDALLDSAEVRTKFETQINWSEVQRYRGIGGVRIEDNVLITEGEPEVLTAAIPKSLTTGG